MDYTSWLQFEYWEYAKKLGEEFFSYLEDIINI